MFMLMCTNHTFFFFFNDTATTEIYTLSLHDALPISRRRGARALRSRLRAGNRAGDAGRRSRDAACRPEIGRAHAELQSLAYLVCRLLLEKKKIHLNRE